MITFRYAARDMKDNRVIKDSISANSEKEAAGILMSQGLSIIELKEDRDRLFGGADKVPTKQRIIFTRQLSTLINAGLPVGQSLRTISEQTQSKNMQRITQFVLADIESGKSLSEAFARWPRVFNQIYVSIVAAGELAGTLDKSLARLADQEDHDAEMMSKIKSAMTYPAIVIVVIIAVVIFLLMTVMPQVEQLYQSLGQQLPWMTQVMVNLANFIGKFWWLVLIIVAVLVFFWLRWIKTKRGRHFLDNIKINFPVVKNLFIKLYASRFCRTMEILLGSGVHVLEAMEISARSVNNVIIEAEIMRDTPVVKGGKALSKSLEHEEGEGYIPNFVSQMVSIGEKSGQIDEMLGKTATYYENEVDAAIKALQQMIEPVLMVLLAFVAGIMIVAVLVPIYNLSSMTTL